MSEPRERRDITEGMRLVWWLLVATGCRIGFDPVTTDAGPDPARSAITCTPGQICIIDCATVDTCVVDCRGAASCIVTCDGKPCTAANCGPDCVVDCGDGTLPSRNGPVATCS